MSGDQTRPTMDDLRLAGIWAQIEGVRARQDALLAELAKTRRGRLALRLMPIVEAYAAVAAWVIVRWRRRADR